MYSSIVHARFKSPALLEQVVESRITLDDGVLHALLYGSQVLLAIHLAIPFTVEGQHGAFDLLERGGGVELDETPVPCR